MTGSIEAGATGRSLLLEKVMVTTNSSGNPHQFANYLDASCEPPDGFDFRWTGRVFLPEVMNHPPTVAADSSIKPLLVACFPEGGLFFFPDFAVGIAGLAPSEIALSHSCQEHGLLRPLAAKWKIHTESEADLVLARIGLFDLLIVAPLSLNSLAKFALGIRDSFPSRVFGAMADCGKPILLESSCIPRDDALLNPHYSKIYRRYWDSVRIGAVSGFSRDGFDSVIFGLNRSRRAILGRPAVGGRAVLTRDDVLDAFKAMQPLFVPRGALLTDLAREEAVARGVPINYE